eukprot:11207323-Lingulodinium_polyedra.AAC.1
MFKGHWSQLACINEQFPAPPCCHRQLGRVIVCHGFTSISDPMFRQVVVNHQHWVRTIKWDCPKHR